MPKWLKLLIITAVALVSPFILMQAIFIFATAPMVAIADDLYPSPGWTKDDHNISGGPLCLGIAGDCDKMWQSYRTSQRITTAEIQQISDGAGLGARVEGNCESMPPGEQYWRTCSVKGMKDGYDVEISVMKPSDDSPQKIVTFSVSSVANRS